MTGCCSNRALKLFNNGALWERLHIWYVSGMQMNPQHKNPIHKLWSITVSCALPESSPSKYLTIRSSPDLTSELYSRTRPLKAWRAQCALLFRNVCKTLSDLNTPLIMFIWDRKGWTSTLHLTKDAILLLSLTFNSEPWVTSFSGHVTALSLRRRDFSYEIRRAGFDKTSWTSSYRSLGKIHGICSLYGTFIKIRTPFVNNI